MDIKILFYSCAYCCYKIKFEVFKRFAPYLKGGPKRLYVERVKLNYVSKQLETPKSLPIVGRKDISNPTGTYNSRTPKTVFDWDNHDSKRK